MRQIQDRQLSTDWLSRSRRAPTLQARRLRAVHRSDQEESIERPLLISWQDSFGERLAAPELEKCPAFQREPREGRPGQAERDAPTVMLKAFPGRRRATLGAALRDTPLLAVMIRARIPRFPETLLRVRQVQITACDLRLAQRATLD